MLIDAPSYNYDNDEDENKSKGKSSGKTVNYTDMTQDQLSSMLEKFK